MIEPIDNYPLSSEQNSIIPLQVAKPSALYWLTASTAARTLEFPNESNNIFTVSADVLTFISTNPNISSFDELTQGVRNDGVYIVTPDYAHILALPKTVKVFNIVNKTDQNIYLQELVRWAAAGGQAISFGIR